MTVIEINPLRPFKGMSRPNDYLEMVTNSLSEAFCFNNVAKSLLNEVVHNAYSLKGQDMILSDLVLLLADIKQMDAVANDLYRILYPFACDKTFPEYNLFCDRGGLPLNALDVDGMKTVLMQVSNHNIRTFFERMFVLSLMF